MDFGLLRRLTAETDEQHRAALETIHDDLGEVHFGTADDALVASRRSFLRRAAGGAAIAFGAATVPLAAIASPAGAQAMDDTGDDGDDHSADLTTTDLQIVQFAETVELAAVAAYGLAEDRNLLASAPTESLRTFGRHHREHAAALRSLWATDDDPESEPNAALVNQLAPVIQGAADGTELVTVLYGIEQGAAATYYATLGVLERSVAGAASSILPVEAQHAVVWGQFLELPIEDWVPAFQTDVGAFTPGDDGDATADDDDNDDD